MRKIGKNTFLFLAIPLLIISITISILQLDADNDLWVEDVAEDVIDLDDILERGVLRAITDFNSTNYFIYRGEPMGFHLELLQHFAAHLGVDLELSVTNDLDESIRWLSEEGGYDLMAQSLPVTASLRQSLSLSESFAQTHLVLVQRKPAHWHNMRSSEIEGQLLRQQLDLGRKTVHVNRHSAAISRLQHLMEEIGDTIHVVARDESVEQLIEMVAEGEIEYTVSDDKLARLHEMYYAHIDTQTPLGFRQNLSWATREGADELLAALNEWLAGFKETRLFTDIYNKYYNNPRSVFIAKSELHSLGGGKISVFDDYFKRYADIIGWDWRLIASLSYQESRFNPSAVSWAGAFGLMQLMPSTADFMNLPEEATIQDHVYAAIRYLRWIDRRLGDEIPDLSERKLFVLASYNAGLGHVLDARRLAEKYGRNPNVWKGNVDYFLLNKSDPKYYRDAVVRHGFVRGSEPYHYVSEVMERYRHYMNVLES